MAMYKITFHPFEPYFFGNEKTFGFAKNTTQYGNLYFIRGEKMPSQSTILGALRYILMPEKGFDRLREPKNIAAIGPESFDIDSDHVQNFGLIKKLYPVFLEKKLACREAEYFVPTPLDHNCAAKGVENTLPYYTPLKDYRPLSPDGERIYPADYEAKKGLTDSFMSLHDGHLETNAVGSSVRVGINRRNKKDGFFKKEYHYLTAGFSFCTFAEIGGELPPFIKESPQTVFMGQGKAPFSVCFTKMENEYLNGFIQPLTGILRRTHQDLPVLYCLSDVLTDGDDTGDLYRDMRFAIVQTRDYRSYKTGSRLLIEKGQKLHRLVKAGSVFFPKERQKPYASVNIQQKNAELAGYHHIIQSWEEK